MTNITTDSEHGDTSVSHTTSSDPNISALNNTNNELNQIRDQIEQEYQNLPANQAGQGNINFLGSSYSGVDLKVVAHMYDAIKWVDEKLEQLEVDAELCQTIIDGCTNLIAGGLDGLAQQEETGNPLFFGDYAAKKEIFIAATGIPFPSSEVNQRAINLLVGNVFAGLAFTFVNVARMKQAALTVQQYQEYLLTDLRNRIENLQSIKDSESSDTVVLGSLQTISVQTFRPKAPVRALGHSYPKGYTRGTRMIAGSMIFTIFNEHALSAMIRAMGNSRTYGERDAELSSLLPDQLPPIDITISFANEYGSLSDMKIYGLEFISDSAVFSIEDLLSEGVMNFVCRDADLMTSRGRIRINRLQRGMFNDKDDKDLTGSSLLFDNAAYNEYLDRLHVRRRLKNR